MRLVTCSLVALFVAIPTFPEAAPLLDQQSVTTSDFFLNGGSILWEWQQGVTTGIAGRLAQIDVFVHIFPNDPPPVPTELSVNVGAPWQTDADEWSIIATLNEGWNSFDVTAASIDLTVGTQFVIGVHGQGVGVAFNPGIGWSFNDDPYTGGGLFLNSDGSGSDMTFRTYVEPVPEPSTFALIGLSLISLGRRLIRVSR